MVERLFHQKWVKGTVYTGGITINNNKEVVRRGEKIANRCLGECVKEGMCGGLVFDLGAVCRASRANLEVRTKHCGKLRSG